MFLVVVRAFFMEALKRVDRRQNEVFKWREKAGVRRMLVTVNNTLLCGGGGRFLYESLNNIPLYRPSPPLSLAHTAAWLCVVCLSTQRNSSPTHQRIS